MTIPVPTLSSAGWVTDPAGKADYLLSHFYETDKQQSYLYVDSTTSLQAIIERYGHDVATLCDQLRRALNQYLLRYYPSVLVDVSADTSEINNNSGQYTLRVYCQATETDGKSYSFGRLVLGTSSKFERVMDLNNTLLYPL